MLEFVVTLDKMSVREKLREEMWKFETEEKSIKEWKVVAVHGVDTMHLDYHSKITLRVTPVKKKSMPH